MTGAAADASARGARLGQRVAASAGWRRALLAGVAGAISVLAMAPFFLSPVLFLTLPVLVWLIDGADHPARVTAIKRAAWAGWWFGFGYFFAGLFWVGEAFLVEAEKFALLLPFAVTLLPAGLALFFAAAAAAARMFWRPGFHRILTLALALSAAEWLRGHIFTGFPWNVLGYALTSPLPLMQSAGLAGIYALTILTVVVFATPLVRLDETAPGRERLNAWQAVLLATVVPLGLLLAYGTWRLSTPSPPDVPQTVLRIVQPSVKQRDKWRPEKQREIFEDHLTLSRQNPAGVRDDLAAVTHVVWPEAAMPFLPLSSPEALGAIAELLPERRFLLTGALRLEVTPPSDTAPAARRAYNSLMAFDDAGLLAALYDKTHLVPFGEYLPYQTLLESIGLEQLTRMRGGFTPGIVPRPLVTLAGLPPFAALVCYEAIFPAALVHDRTRRPGLLLNLTNDGWFGNTTGPRQHFHQARVRAVEEGLPLIRAANNGISAVIDADGRVRAELAMNIRGVIDSPIPGARSAPPYARWGDAIFFLFWIVTAFMSATNFSSRTKRGI